MELSLRKAPMKIAAVVFASLLAMAIANAQTDAKPEIKPEIKPDGKADAKTDTKPAAAKKAKSADAHAAAAADPAKDLPKDVKKLIMEDAIPGQGKVASKGKRIKVNYTGWLYDASKSMGRGKQFDSSVGHEPFTFTLGGGEVIKGWDEGFENMKVGGKRKLIIPSELGYGTRGAGTAIPPNAPLMFEVELLDVL